MAVVWVKQAGNWTDTTLWAFWNETTQQIEDYGQVPQVGDTVYCNSFQITLNTDVNISSGEIRNDINPYTNAIDGRLYTTVNRTIIANLHAHSEIIYVNRNSPTTLNINGNINGELDAHHIIGRSSNDALYLYINGNTFCEGVYFITNASSTAYTCVLNINGNFTLKQEYTNRDEFSARSTITVNGQLVVYKTFSIYTLTITGKLLCDKATINCNSVIVNGSIDYKTSVNQNFGIVSNNITILNSDTFTWKDITEPQRVNPFIIVTDAEMNNRQQYPPENEVKEGTEYVYGQKVGTYQQPPESVVLNGYIYDNGDKTGTMPVLSQQLISRLENCATVETVQQLLVAHLDN